MSMEPNWKARAEAAEARVSWLEEQISYYREDLRVQKASHETRVRELAARLTVTDEMVERAAKTLQQYCLLPLPPWTTVARAALTAALENKS